MNHLKHVFNRFAILGALTVCLGSSLFAQTGGLKGKVRADRGDAIPNATITVRKSGQDVKAARSDSKGAFVIEGLEAGNYNVVFDASGFGAGILYNVEVKRSKTRDLGERLILFPDQGTQVIIKGSVFYKEGTSVTGAKIDIERVNADGSTRKIGSGLTSVSGEFTFRQPQADAKFRITARFKDATGVKEVVVNNAGIYRLAITLDVSRTER